MGSDLAVQSLNQSEIPLPSDDFFRLATGNLGLSLNINMFSCCFFCVFFVCVCLHVSLYVSNHFNHCIKLFAPCGPLIANKTILLIFLSETKLRLEGTRQQGPVKKNHGTKIFLKLFFHGKVAFSWQNLVKSIYYFH